MTDYTKLIHRLRAAAEEMRKGIFTMAHVALVLEAANAIYDLTHPKNWTLSSDKEPTHAKGKN